MKGFVRKGLIAILVLTFIIIGIVIYAFISTHNPVSGVLSLNGLQGRVTVQRDNNGVPHIKAEKSDTDAFFALGFVTAQDRYWQLEFQRLLVQGRLSEVFGDTTIDTDKFFRTMGLHRNAQESWNSLSLQTQDAISAYTKGINAFLETGNLPLQFKFLRYQPQLWTEIDILDQQKLMSLGLNNDFFMQWENLQLLQKLKAQTLIDLRGVYPADAITVLSKENLSQSGLLFAEGQSPVDKQKQFKELLENTSTHSGTKNHHDFLQAGAGSNCWVVDGTLTASGKPILASDPHLELNMPGVWYLAELQGPTLHVMGVTSPGLPFILIGHNDQIGWGITNARVEISTLKIMPANANFTTHQETLLLRNGSHVNFKVTNSAQGPVMNAFLQPKAKKGVKLVLTSTVFSDKDSSMDAFYQLNYAKDWLSFRKAMSFLVSPGVNFLYADNTGNIGYQLAGLIPLRKKSDLGNDANLPETVTGKEPTQLYIPFEKMPFVLNPKSHFLVSSNNKIVPDDYPYRLNRFWDIPPYRAQRINQLLQEKIKKNHLLTLNDMAAIQNDTGSIIWQSLRPVLLGSSDNKINQQGLQLLSQWDGNMKTDSVGATIFAYWFRELINELKSPMGVDAWLMSSLAVVNQLTTKSTWCAEKLACDQLITRTFNQAMAQLKQDLGTNPANWQWGRVHIAMFNEIGIGEVPVLGLIWNRSIPSPGGVETVNVGNLNFNDFLQFAGASSRQLLDFGELDNSLYVIPTGQSDNVFSENHADLMPYWQQAKYIKLSPLPQQTKQLVLMPNNQEGR